MVAFLVCTPPYYLETFFRVGTFVLEIAVGDVSPTQLSSVIHIGSNNPMLTVCKGSLLNSFDAVSTHRSATSWADLSCVLA